MRPPDTRAPRLATAAARHVDLPDGLIDTENTASRAPAQHMTDAAILLAKMRRASLQLRLADASIEEAAVPLSRGWISVPGAIATLRNNDVLWLVLPELDGIEEDAGR